MFTCLVSIFLFALWLLAGPRVSSRPFGLNGVSHSAELPFVIFAHRSVLLFTSLIFSIPGFFYLPLSEDMRPELKTWVLLASAHPSAHGD